MDLENNWLGSDLVYSLSTHEAKTQKSGRGNWALKMCRKHSLLTVTEACS